MFKKEKQKKLNQNIGKWRELGGGSQLWKLLFLETSKFRDAHGVYSKNRRNAKC